MQFPLRGLREWIQVTCDVQHHTTVNRLVSSGKVPVRVVWACFFFLGWMFSVWVEDYDQTLPLPVVFARVGARRTQSKSRVNFRTIRLTCPLFLTTCSYLITYLTTLCLLRRRFLYVWNFRQAGSQSTKRVKEAKPAPRQLCELAHRLTIRLTILALLGDTCSCRRAALAYTANIEAGRVGTPVANSAWREFFWSCEVSWLIPRVD